MKWTDENIDKLFQEGAGKVSFEYKPDYWDAFEGSIPTEVSAADMTDTEIDALFKEDASQVSANYKPEFWEEFSASLPIIIPTEEVTDGEVDNLYRESVADLSFKYKPSYWDEMAALLSRRKRPDFLWFGLSSLFAAGLICSMLIEQNPIAIQTTTAAFELSSISDSKFISGTNNPTDHADTQVQVAQNNLLSNPSNSITGQNSGNGMNGATVSPIEGSIGTPNTTAVATGNIGRNPIIASIKPNTLVNPIIANSISLHSERTAAEDITLPKSLETLVAEELKTETEELAASTSEFPGLPKAHESGRLSFYLQGVAGISQSSISPSEYLSSSYGIGAGLAVNRRLLTYNIGTNVLIHNYKDLNLTRTAKQYGFGSEQITQDLQYNNLYKLELDLSMSYNIRRHQIQLGVRPSFAFSSKVDVTETSTTTSKGEVIESSPTRTLNYGGMVGIKQWGLKPTLGYAYNFNRGWSLGANIGTELLQSIDEVYIEGINNKYYIDGQLYIRKTIKLRK